jgi:hypothetical protein
MRVPFRLVGWTLAVAGLVLAWVLLAGRFDRHELLAALAAGVVAVGVGILAHRHSGLEHRPDPLLWRLGGTLAVAVVVDLWWSWKVLLDHARGRRNQGRWVDVPFAASGRDPDGVARRTAIVVAGSLSATTYVADVDLERGSALVHQLVDTGRPAVPSRLLEPT